MENVAVRWFQPQDADAVVRLHAENKDWFEEDGLTREFIIESASRQDFKLMIAEISGEVVGFVGTLFFTAVGRAELGPIGLKQEYQNHGIGNGLVSEMLNFLKSAGIHRVVVHVKATNINAIKFFLNSGFVFEAYLQQYTRKREAAVQMLYLLD